MENATTPTGKSAVVRECRLRQASNEGLHLRLVDGKVHELIRYRFGGEAKPRSTAP